MAIQYGIHDYREFQPTLKAPQVELSTYNPISVVYQAMDPSIYQNNINKMDEASEKNLEKETAIDEYYSTMLDQTHDDEKTRSIARAAIEADKKEFNDALDANMGSMHRMNKVVGNLAKKAKANFIITGLAKQNKAKEDFVNASIRNNRNLDESSKRFYEDRIERNYSNNAREDANGNIIGFNNWDPGFTVYDDFNIDEIGKSILAFTAYKEKGSETSSEGISGLSDGKEVKISSSDLSSSEFIKHTSSSDSKIRTWLDPEQLNQTLDDYLKANPTVLEQIREQGLKDEFKVNEARAKLKDPSKLTTEEINRYQNEIDDYNSRYGTGQAAGSMNAEQYYINRIKGFMKNSAYDRVRTGHSSGVSLSGTGARSKKALQEAVNIAKATFGSQKAAIEAANSGNAYGQAVVNDPEIMRELQAGN